MAGVQLVFAPNAKLGVCFYIEMPLRGARASRSDENRNEIQELFSQPGANPKSLYSTCFKLPFRWFILLKLFGDLLCKIS